MELTERIARIIAVLGLQLSEGELKVPCKQFYTGPMFDFAGMQFNPTKPEGWLCMEEWSKNAREVYVNLAERSILTYCEGDISLTIDASLDEFITRLAAAAEFYREEKR